MNTFLAIVYFMLSLVGLDLGSSTFVHRSSHDGAATLESRAEVTSGVARFKCVRSASGRCHYALLPAGCGRSRRGPWPARPCPTDPMERFSLAAGQSRQVAGLARFELCVGADERACPAPATPVPAGSGAALGQGTTKR